MLPRLALVPPTCRTCCRTILPDVCSRVAGSSSLATFTGTQNNETRRRMSLQQAAAGARSSAQAVTALTRHLHHRQSATPAFTARRQSNASMQCTCSVIPERPVRRRGQAVTRCIGCVGIDGTARRQLDQQQVADLLVARDTGVEGWSARSAAYCTRANEVRRSASGWATTAARRRVAVAWVRGSRGAVANN